ncbi:hypothetical protein HY388_01895 [Candidatus Daviesbacteria bacterium]|nr:hypothetical protein [Candidatus Daviesbacteria bacterium]
MDQIKTETTEVQQPTVEASKASVVGIGEQFLKDLQEKGLALQTPLEVVGEIAKDYATNETGSPSLFEKIQSQKEAPDGYLVGIGAGNVFSMLEAFPEGQLPKAILLFDINYEAVASGQALIEKLKRGEPCPYTSAVTYTNIDKNVFTEDLPANIKFAWIKYWPTLTKLAQAGNLAIAQVDFANPELMNLLANLPQFKDSNNVVYLSNIADHIWRRKPVVVPDLGFLRILTPDFPHNNYYIDTLLSSLDYRLRASTHPPEFSRTDFSDFFQPVRFQTRPIDEVDGPVQENPLRDDLQSWTLEHLVGSYTSLDNSKRHQARKEFIGRRISEMRNNTRDTYDEYKKRPQSGKVTDNIEIKYQFPAGPEEEAKLLEELRQPYNYDCDFIPFLANYFWANAQSPEEFMIEKLPEVFFKDSASGASYYIYDPRASQKGRVEIGLLRSGIYYEQLAMAKIYQEVKKRVLQKNPDIDVSGKTFPELVDRLQFGRPAKAGASML